MPVPARNPLIARWTARWCVRAMRSRFHGFFVEGADHARAAGAGRAVIACANHTNFWDGFVALVFGERVCGRAVHVLQEERHLARYPFLRRAGAIGIDLGSPAAMVAGMRSGFSVLRDPRSMLWVFPQGRIEHPCEPVEVRPGACRMAHRAGCPILPIAIAYEWVSESRPGIYVFVGEPLEPGTEDATLREAIHAGIARLRDRVAHRRFADLEAVIPMRRSPQRLWDRLRHALRGDPAPFDWRMP